MKNLIAAVAVLALMGCDQSQTVEHNGIQMTYKVKTGAKFTGIIAHINSPVNTNEYYFYCVSPELKLVYHTKLNLTKGQVRLEIPVSNTDDCRLEDEYLFEKTFGVE